MADWKSSFTELREAYMQTTRQSRSTGFPKRGNRNDFREVFGIYLSIVRAPKLPEIEFPGSRQGDLERRGALLM